MFNPKHNLLEEQLAASGIEHGILDFVKDVVTGGAHSANKSAKKAEKKQKEYNEKVAQKQNEYSQKLDEADIANYHTQRDHAYLMALRDWEYGKQIQDYKYSQVLREYEKSQAIGNQQLGLNAEAERQAIAAEQGVLDDAFTNFAFERQNNLSAAQDAIAIQAINRQSTNLDKLGLDLESASKEVDRLGIGLDRLSKISDRESLALKLEGTGFDLKDLGIAAASKNLDLEQLGLDRASKQLDKKALSFNLLSKQADRQALGFARLGKGLDRQAQAVKLEGIESKRQFGSMAIQNTIDQLLTQNTLQKEAAMVRSLAALGKAELGQAGKSTAKAQQAVMAELHRGLMAMDIEMSGKHKQAAIQMAELNADASLQKSQVGINLQRIGLEEAGLDLQGQRIGIEEGLIGLQGQQIGLQESILDKRAQQIELQKAGIATQVGRVGLAQSELAIQGDRISIAEGRLTAAERGIDIAQAGIGIQRGRIGLEEIGINNAINQAQRDYQFNNEVLRANLNSTIDASIRNVDRIRMQREVTDVNTTAAMLLEPERVDYVPEPQLPPERQFVARMEAIPGFVPPAHQQNLFAAGVSTVASYATTAMNIYNGIGNLSKAQQQLV